MIAAGIALIAVALARALPADAQNEDLHPAFSLLDREGNPVQSTGLPVSTLKTCGGCHDTAFIADHDSHQGVLSGALATPAGEALFVDPESGAVTPLADPAGGTEMNCFLCHTASPNNTARLEALADGQYEWLATATLLGTGAVEMEDGTYRWQAAAFETDGTLRPGVVTLQDPAPENCGLCHGLATSDPVTPLTMPTCGTVARTTITTGQVFSPQRISESGLNIAGKDRLTRSWDVHSERMVGCVDCHYSLNNPIDDRAQADESLAHLTFDPRRLDLRDYLTRPRHELARSSADPSGPDGCTSCHDAETRHSWLPYTEQHLEALACETCHVPRLEVSARQSIDWTVLTPLGGPTSTCRGQVKDPQVDEVLLAGYEPARIEDGQGRIAPYNLITTWYWASGEASHPVALADLRAAYFEGGTYAPQVLAAFDASRDGHLDDAELTVDSSAKEALIQGRLAERGLLGARIVGVVQAFPIHHSVAAGEDAIRDCQICHTSDSALAAPMALGNLPHGGALPTWSGAGAAGYEIRREANGLLTFTPRLGSAARELYVFGRSRSLAVDRIGLGFFLVTLLAVAIHGGARVATAARASHVHRTRRAYLYGVYERLWHWLQTAAILLLLFTGLIIHRPDSFPGLSFSAAVYAHNVLAVILVINAGLSAFYHLASGEIRQYLPQPYGFFGQAFLQIRFYLQGIFRGDRHPLAKTPRRKLNPLQQVVYLGLLNVLLPLQVITGALIWGAQHWPEAVARLGGLAFLAPAHSLIAWLLASFVVGHVYLTTTGPAPLASMQGMIMGWEPVEVTPRAKG